MGEKLRKIKADWSTFDNNEESQHFSATWRAKAKGLDPVTGFMPVTYSAGPDVFGWSVDSNQNGTFDRGADRGLMGGNATSIDTDAFYSSAKLGSGTFKIKELKNDNFIATIKSNDGHTAVVSDFGGWTFSELWMVLDDLA